MIVFDNADPIEPPAPVTKTVLPRIVLFIDPHVRVNVEEIDPQVYQATQFRYAAAIIWTLKMAKQRPHPS
jgi:hypothetical protein